ncbi:MAG: DNA-binding winged helix-turn-helix (wHTH) protein [Paraglaciecola sp.]|jgi:DNA-binding winged helix-turn-helix (wHTH) protein/energy-coupling factor transporter ATP-binding protein EcfA2
MNWYNKNVIEKAPVFFIGDWQVTPASNSLRCGDNIRQIEPKAMDVLLLLCQQADLVLSADDIVEQCWGNTDIGDNPVHKAINQLRKAFDDKPSQPKYIETIRKRGYRIVAALSFPLDDELNAVKNEWLGDSPFPGLSAFEPSDTGVFFGRNQQISTLLERISTQVNFGRAFCLILGPSGSGKSSLINAGLLPRLLHHNGYDGIGVLSYTSLDFADISHGRLFIDLASALLDWECKEHPVFAGLSADILAEQLQSNSQQVITLCRRALDEASHHYGRAHFFLFIDRLEVLLSSPHFSDEEREVFLQIIETLATSGCIMVFSACRNDFYPLVVIQASLMAGKSNGAHFDLIAPHRSELMQMIRLPAVAANLSWSKDPHSARPLDEILCAEAANNPDCLPMLQYTLQELYLQRSDNNELQYSVYKDLGGIDGAIGKKAEEVYQQLVVAQQSQLAYVLSLLVTLSPDGETITSRAARWSQLDNQSQTEFVQAMVDSRLFVSHLQNEEACFSLAHEALLRRWSRASHWIVAHQDSLEIKSRLQRMTERWLHEGKSSAYLLAQGKPLQEAQSLEDNRVFTLDKDERALITASQKRVISKRWVTRSTIILLSVLSFTAVFMSIKSQQAESFAQQKRLDAENLLGFMVGEFADKLRGVKRMDLLDGISNKALEYFSQQDADYDNSEVFSFTNPALNFKTRFQHAQTLSAMGEVAYSRAKTDEAHQAFTSARVILEKLYKEQAENLELLKTLGANAFWLGQLAYDQSDFDHAQPLFESYRDYSEQMNHLEPDNVDGWIELYNAHNTLGSLYIKQQNYAVAKLAFESALMLNNRALKLQPHDSLLRSDKADTLSWLATTEQHLGNISLTLTLHQQGQRELEAALVDSPNDAYLLESLTYSLMTQARILDYLGQTPSAYAKSTRALNFIQKALNQDPSNEIWDEQRLSILILQILTNSKINDAEMLVTTQLEQVIENFFSKVITRPNIPIDIIKYYQLKEEWLKSNALINKTKDYLSALYSHNKDEPNYVLAFAELKMLQAHQSIYNNNPAEKVAACKEAIQLLSPLVVNSSNVEYLLPFAQAHSCLNRLSAIPKEIKALQGMAITNLNFQANNPTENSI